MQSNNSYEHWLQKKILSIKESGFDPGKLPDCLFPFQKDLTTRACKLGRYALFCDTGTGKTIMQLAWAHKVVQHTKGRVLILAPLAVAQQTEQEGKKFDLHCKYLRKDNPDYNIVVTNYDMLHMFNAANFTGVVLDESSILKSFDGATRNEIINTFIRTPYKLACTATPAPNDYTELGNHSEFLGYKTRVEMLSEFFVHDGEHTTEWRLKGHAETIFWQWICGWAAVMSKPSDLGYDDDGFNLPALRTHDVIVGSRGFAEEQGVLFANAPTLNEQRKLRRSTIHDRISKAAELANCNEPVIVWCELNDESAACTELIKGAKEIKGPDNPIRKSDLLTGFSRGEYRCLVTKPSIAGFGMNWQHCAKIVFVGASHSFEQTYQAIRRCWRFGQKKPVDVYFIRADADTPISDNFKRKALAHETMIKQMSVYANQGKISRRWNEYNANNKVEIPEWLK